MMIPKSYSSRRKPKSTCIVVGCDTRVNNSKYCKLHQIKILTPSRGLKSPKAKKPKKKPTELKKWIRKMDRVFSVYIRLRDTGNDGFGKCISSGSRIYYIVDTDGKILCNTDAGHFVSRRVMSLRFDEGNVFAQHRFPNRYCEGQHDLYAESIRKICGQEELDRLYLVKTQNRKYTAFELEQMYKFYETKVEAYLVLKHWWCNQRTIKSLYQ